MKDGDQSSPQRFVEDGSAAIALGVAERGGWPDDRWETSGPTALYCDETDF